jgi:hypothetical protein
MRGPNQVREVRKARYEATYAVVPEGPFPVDPTDYPLEPVTADEFGVLWNSDRSRLAG